MAVSFQRIHHGLIPGEVTPVGHTGKSPLQRVAPSAGRPQLLLGARGAARLQPPDSKASQLPLVPSHRMAHTALLGSPTLKPLAADEMAHRGGEAVVPFLPLLPLSGNFGCLLVQV